MSLSPRLPFDILALLISLPPAYAPTRSLFAWSLVSRETSWLARRALYARWEVADDFGSYCRFIKLFADPSNPGGLLPPATSFLSDLTLRLPAHPYAHLPLPITSSSGTRLKAMTIILPRGTARLETHHVPLLRFLGRPENVVVRLAEGSEDGYVWMGEVRKREVRGWLEGKMGWEGGRVEVEVVGSDSGDESSFEWSSNRAV